MPIALLANSVDVLVSVSIYDGNSNEDGPLASSNSGPSGRDTLRLRAVFVPEGSEDDVPTQALAVSLGVGVVKFPAILVPEGEAPPGYPYVPFGRMEFDEDKDDNSEQDFPGSQAEGTWEPAHRDWFSQTQSGSAADRTDDAPDNGSIGDSAGADQHGIWEEGGTPPNPALGDEQRFPGPVGSGTVNEMPGGADVSANAGVPSDDQTHRSFDPSQHAIDAAVQALTATPTDGKPTQSVDWATDPNWPGSKPTDGELPGELSDTGVSDAISDQEEGATTTQPARPDQASGIDARSMIPGGPRNPPRAGELGDECAADQ